MTNDLDPRKGKRTIEIPFRWLVRKNDADFERDRLYEPEYDYNRRTFKGKRNARGAYDGTYPDPLYSSDDAP
jgi:hypothetical protein